jgi:hypothetical protein
MKKKPDYSSEGAIFLFCFNPATKMSVGCLMIMIISFVLNSTESVANMLVHNNKLRLITFKYLINNRISLINLLIIFI